MNNLTLTNQFSKEVFNFTQKFTKELPKPQQANFRELFRWIILWQTSQLASISRSNKSENNTRKDIERLSNTLSKIPNKEFSQIHINHTAMKYKDEPVLILSDGGDYQKPNGQKMEYSCYNVDGSNWHKVWYGYPIEALVAYWTESETITPLISHVFSTQTEDYKSDFFEHKKAFEMLDLMINNSDKDRVIVEDRWCDSEKRFLYFLNELKCSFVTRVSISSKSRNVLLKDIDGNYMKTNMRDLSVELKDKAKSWKIWFNQKKKETLESRIAYQEIYLPWHKNIPLYAIFTYSEWFEEPLVVLTDLSPKNDSDAWKYFFYYKKRWEVENYFRSIKQSFNAEKFLVRKLHKIQSLSFLLAIVVSFLVYLSEKAVSFFSAIYDVFKNFCKKEQRSWTHYLDILHFFNDYLEFPPAYSYRFWSQSISFYRSRFDKNQLSLFKNSKKLVNL